MLTIEGWLRGEQPDRSSSAYSDAVPPAHPLHDLAPFNEAEHDPSPLIEHFLHHQFPRSLHAIPRQPKPDLELVNLHEIEARYRQDHVGHKKGAPAPPVQQIKLGSAPAILAIGPGVWEAGKLSDVFKTQAAALFATQPTARDSKSLNFTTEQGVRMCWTYIMRLMNNTVKYSPSTGGGAGPRQADSLSVWLLRQLDSKGAVFKKPNAQRSQGEVGILVVFLSGTKEEEHARRVRDVGGPNGINLILPSQNPISQLIHALLKHVDQNNIDQLDHAWVPGKKDSKDRLHIEVTGAYVYNPLSIYGEKTVNYSLPTGWNTWQDIEITGLDKTYHAKVRYKGQTTDKTLRATSSRWHVEPTPNPKFWGTRVFLIEFMHR